MAPRRSARDAKQDDLFDWQPPAVTAARFEDQVTAAASLRGKLCRAMAAALKECGKSRDEVAQEMSAYLGERISKAGLDALVSEAKGDHPVSVERFVALIQATGDYRLLTLIGDLFEIALVHRRYLPAIEDAMLADKIEEMAQRQKLARKRWKGVAP